MDRSELFPQGTVGYFCSGGVAFAISGRWLKFSSLSPQKHYVPLCFNWTQRYLAAAADQHKQAASEKPVSQNGWMLLSYIVPMCLHVNYEYDAC